MRRLCRAGMLSLFAASLCLAAHAQRADVQTWIDAQVSDGKALSISAAWLQDGKVAYASGGVAGPDRDRAIDGDSQYQIGSVTKAFTNLLLAEMVAANAVTYDTTVGDVLGDDFEPVNPAVADISLEQLATHTSGLPRLPVNLVPTNPLDPYAGYDEEALLQGLAASRAGQPLGRHYAYSNFGVGLLGYLLGRVDGGGFRQALQQHILAPLQLADTRFTPDNGVAGFRGGRVVPDWRLDSLDGAGGLWSTTSDLVRLARLQLGQLAHPLEQALPDNFDVRDAGPDGFRVTRVWHVADSDAGTVFWHNGGTGGFWSFFGFRPATSEALAILVSGDSDPTGVGLDWFGRKAFAADTDAPDPALFGQYELAPGVGIGIYADNQQLLGQLSGQPPLALIPVGDDWYAAGAVDASIRFVRSGGRVDTLELVQNGVTQTARRRADTADALARTAIELSRETLAQYTGEYTINPMAKFTIRLADAGLEAQITGQPFFPIFAKDDDVFFYKVVDAELHFERDADGDVVALTLHQGSIRQRAEKVD